MLPLSLGRMPPQGTPFERAERQMDRQAEEPDRDCVRVQLVVEPERLDDVDLLTEPRDAHEELGREREDERNGR